VCEDGTCIIILICAHTHGDGKSEKRLGIDYVQLTDMIIVQGLSGDADRS
jgi:hypothetical protein